MSQSHPASKNPTLDDVLLRLSERFTSGNIIPVERAHLTRDEGAVLMTAIVELRKPPRQPMTQAVPASKNQSPQLDAIKQALDAAAIALPVLFDMCTAAGLRAGAMAADEILGSVKFAQKEMSHLLSGANHPTPEKSACPNCGSAAVTEAEETYTFDYGSSLSVPLTVTHPIMRCTECKEAWSDWRGEEAREAAVDRYRTVMGAPIQAKLDAAETRLRGYEAWERSVNEALNSGDGSYRP